MTADGNPGSTGGMTQALQPCGTWGAYKRHLKAGEVPCEPCRHACRDRARRRYDPAKARARRTPTARVPRWFGMTYCGSCGRRFIRRRCNAVYCSRSCYHRARHDRASRG